ncbi:unnamed protein product [Miscanthus lutarioriparius]|uniref:Uncharacterized protein n=1 Tax=Miscanthus lutarioriparius TaxID=422564 RepID=A0A811QN26_9POAL|nr:unnamed protein product [Miscanthus lutarioriparius]
MGMGDLDLAGAMPTLSMRIVSKRIHQQWHGAPRVAQVATLADTVYPECSYQHSERAEEREAEVREAEAMKNALEAALHDDVTKSAKRNMEALLGASTCVLLCERIRDSKDRVVAHRWHGGPMWLPARPAATWPPARPAQTAVAWLAPHDRHPACLRGYGVLDLARRRRGWPRMLTVRRRGCRHRCSS